VADQGGKHDTVDDFVSDAELMDYLLSRNSPSRLDAIERALRRDDRLLARLIEIRAGLDEPSNRADVVRTTRAANAAGRHRVGRVSVRTQGATLTFAFDPAPIGNAFSSKSRHERARGGTLGLPDVLRAASKATSTPQDLRRLQLVASAEEEIRNRAQALEAAFRDLIGSARRALEQFRRSIEAPPRISSSLAVDHDLADFADALRDQLFRYREILATLGDDFERSLFEQQDRARSLLMDIGRVAKDDLMFDKFSDAATAFEALRGLDPTARPTVSRHVLSLDVGPWHLRIEGARSSPPAVRVTVSGGDPAADPPMLTLVEPGKDLEVLDLDRDRAVQFRPANSEQVLLLQAGEVWELALRNEDAPHG
jgi:hypothetical protein